MPNKVILLVFSVILFLIAFWKVRARWRLRSLIWHPELSHKKMSKLCVAYLRLEGIVCYALLQDVKEGPYRRDGHFDVRIPNEQFHQELCVFKLICRPNSYVFGERFFDDIKRATKMSFDRDMTTVVVTTRRPTTALLNYGTTNGIAVIDTLGLQPFAAALNDVKAGKEALYNGGSPVLVEAFRRKTDKTKLAQQEEAFALSAEGCGEWALAEGHWRRCIAADGGNAFTHVRLAETLLAQSKYEEAERVLENASSTFRNHFHIAAAGARIAERRCDWIEAVLRWKEIVQRFPKNWLAYRGTIEALKKKGCEQEAEDFFLRSVTNFPNDGNALFDTVNFAERKRDWVSVEVACRACMAANEAVPWTYVRLARSLKEQGRACEAALTFEEALRVYPGRTEFSLELAKLKSLQTNRKLG